MIWVVNHITPCLISFCQVFKGTVLGQPVAVKTMLTVTEKGVKEFRNEILLTSTLRHPNIVSFVGACWGQELICLVLEVKDVKHVLN
jgi:serine/threonine protein kinase